MHDDSREIDPFIPAWLRELVDKQYYERINKDLTLDKVIQDPEFLSSPLDHLALYTDHSVMHVKNVTQLLLKIIPKIHGVLIPKREQLRLDFMRGYGCVLAYLHDIGMVNPTQFGRMIHAEYLPHALYSEEFEHIFQLIWKNNIGGISWRVHTLILENKLDINPELMLRELLTFAYCHSKSSVPVEKINDKKALREHMQYCLMHTLTEMFYTKTIKKIESQIQKSNRDPVKKEALQAKLSSLQAEYALLEDKEEHNQQRSKTLSKYYRDFTKDSYAWLVMEGSPELTDFVEDIIDTARLLRCADAFRQRGTTLKTSADYQIFIDHLTGNAIYALSHNSDALFLLEVSKSINAAEANLEGLMLTLEGDLIFAFTRGQFATQEATDHAIANMARLVEDIQADVVGSFSTSLNHGQRKGEYVKKGQPMYILLESTDDNPDFNKLLAYKLIQNNPALAPIIKLVPSLKRIALAEKNRYLFGSSLNLTLEEKKQLLAKIEETGHRVKTIPMDVAFDFVKTAALKKDEQLLAAGDFAGFVYIPMGPGLTGFPLGGYKTFKLPAWMPFGNVGVIRGDVRNATIFAETPVEVLIIPREIYLQYWHTTYKVADTYEMAAHLREKKLKK